MKMGELPIDQERLGRPARLAGRQDERPSARHRNAARVLDNTGQGKDTVCELLNPTQVGWLLIELGVRVGRCRARALADPRGQRRHRQSLRDQCSARAHQPNALAASGRRLGALIRALFT
jgi:hypothetical protein